MKTGAEIVLSGSEVSSEEKSIVFDHNASYFITRGKIDDKFNSVLYLNFVVDEFTNAFFVIGWRGRDYLLATVPIECEEYPCSGQVWLGWEAEEVPTIRELLTALGEQIEKTTNYSYTWKTGYLVNQTEGYATDDWDANLIVDAAEIPWNIILPVAMVGIVGLGIVVTKKDKWLR